jgi:hypothetical protein
MSWTVLVLRMGSRFQSPNQEGNHFRDLSLVEGKILKYILEKKCTGVVRLIWLKVGTSDGVL